MQLLGLVGAVGVHLADHVVAGIEGGGDDPANENILVSGNKAVLTRYSAGKDKIECGIYL